MPGAIRAVIDILSERNGHKINLTALSRELDRCRILGFGVEAKDVVYALEREGKVVFDRETETVYLVRKYLSDIIALRLKCIYRLIANDNHPA